MFASLTLLMTACGDSTGPDDQGPVNDTAAVDSIADSTVNDTVVVDSSGSGSTEPVRRPGPASEYTITAFSWGSGGVLTSKEDHRGIIQHLSEYKDRRDVARLSFENMEDVFLDYDTAGRVDMEWVVGAGGESFWFPLRLGEEGVFEAELYRSENSGTQPPDTTVIRGLLRSAGTETVTIGDTTFVARRFVGELVTTFNIVYNPSTSIIDIDVAWVDEIRMYARLDLSYRGSDQDYREVVAGYSLK